MSKFEEYLRYHIKSRLADRLRYGLSDTEIEEEIDREMNRIARMLAKMGEAFQ